ncbi:MAG: hypothetical protein WC152_05980 [Candidatus Izemoplasmatales bacterium]
MDRIELNHFLEEFELFCTNHINSNKAQSYKLALKYLCEFLDIRIMNQDSYDLIINTRNSLRYENSETYKKCLEFLSRRRQRSYLEKGFINAAISQLILYEQSINL